MTYIRQIFIVIIAISVIEMVGKWPGQLHAEPAQYILSSSTTTLLETRDELLDLGNLNPNLLAFKAPLPRPESLQNDKDVIWLYRIDFVKSSESTPIKILRDRMASAKSFKVVSAYSTKTPQVINQSRNSNNTASLKILDFEPPIQRNFVAKVSEAEFQCMAEAIFFEARGEPLAGKYAVGEVILNRVKSKAFPNTICGVVRQGGTKRAQCQFSYYCDGRSEKISEPESFKGIMKITHNIIHGLYTPTTKGATYFHALSSNPRWSKVFQHTATVGYHKFYAN
ncbi:MAG: cell wall hydrolase [Rhodobacteraceae bacterium]|nr:cell wall hydrolase [Paracoccaceae bacterium]